MLDSWIIEELKRREERDGEESARPVLELPVPESQPTSSSDDDEADEDDTPRGVVIIDM